MKTIYIVEEVKSTTPKEFLGLEDTVYRLQKLSVNDGCYSLIDGGRFVDGKAAVIAFKNLDESYSSMLLVVGHDVKGRADLIKTSPIQSVVDSTANSVTFTTETSTYQLTRIGSLENKELRDS